MRPKICMLLVPTVIINVRQLNIIFYYLGGGNSPSKIHVGNKAYNTYQRNSVDINDMYFPVS